MINNKIFINPVIKCVYHVRSSAVAMLKFIKVSHLRWEMRNDLFFTLFSGGGSIGSGITLILT